MIAVLFFVGMSGPNRTHTQTSDLVNRPDKGKSKRVNLPFPSSNRNQRTLFVAQPRLRSRAGRRPHLTYVSKCGARTCRKGATIVAEKVDGAGRLCGEC
jgi:hypothetical protein